MDANKGKKLIKKWEDSINPVTITKAEFQEYITTKIYQYILYRKSNNNLQDLFQDNFKNFNTIVYSLINYILI